MASAFKDKKGWIADFRPYLGAGRQRRRVRVPVTRLRLATSEKEAARDFAAECDRLCRLIELDPRPSHIDYALEIRAITPDDLTRIDGHTPPPSRDRLTIEAAAELHPSTIRESESNQRDYDYHIKCLRDFVAWSGVDHVEDISLESVSRWIAHLKTKKYKWDTRRHYLIPLKRAARMGASLGLPDPLAGHILDRRETPAPVQIWTLKELCEAASGLLEGEQWRELAVLALGGFMGLRPSEIVRAKCGDIEDGILAIGERERKNAQSKRHLPIPALICGWIEPLLNDSPDAPLIRSNSLKCAKSAHFFRGSLAPWFDENVAGFLPIRKGMTVKHLRKSFATWTIREGISPIQIEPYLGHTISIVGDITAKHYLANYQASALAPLAEKINEIVSNNLHALSTPAG